ncbi:MAG: ABC transporter permease [Aquificaceae bacterium]|jgi:lipoprotein-releasing system permease protein|uniref:ABC transporter permease n=1 Tax=Hydrogenobacter sp. Uz 6-8 TaxID=3384828 RepID=UPI0030AC1FC3
MRHVLFVAFKLLLERKRQTLVSVVGVSIGVSAFIVMSSLMLGFQNYFIQQVIDLEPHIRIKPREEHQQVEATALLLGEKPREKDRILGWQDLVQRLEDNSEVLGVAPRLVSRGILKYGVKDKPVTLLGIDPQREPKASVIERFLVHKNLRRLETNRTGVIVGALVAKSLGIEELGKKLLLVAPNGQTILVTVEDFFESGITNIDDTRVYINIKTLQGLLEKEGEVNEIVLKIRDVNLAERLSRKLQSSITYEVESWQKAYRNFLGIFRIQNIITYMIVFAILTVSAFGIFNIIMMTVLEKKKDIAILMAMGFTRKDVLLIFMLEGFVVGVLGALLGSVLGFGLQEYLESVRLDVEGLIRTRGFVLDRSPIFYFYALIFSLFFSLLASLYPSYRASRLNPVDIFRSQ